MATDASAPEGQAIGIHNTTNYSSYWTSFTNKYYIHVERFYKRIITNLLRVNFLSNSVAVYVIHKRTHSHTRHSIAMNWASLRRYLLYTQITKFMGPTWGPPGPCRPQMAPCWSHEPCYLGSEWYVDGSSLFQRHYVHDDHRRQLKRMVILMSNLSSLDDKHQFHKWIVKKQSKQKC